MQVSDSLIEFRNVDKTLGKRKVIRDLSFKIEKGKIFALLGPNGAGKTTTIRLLTGLLAPTSGQIVFSNKSNQQIDDTFRQNIGVQDDGNLYDNLTVIENLDLWGDFYQMPQELKHHQIDEILRFFDLFDRKNSKVGQLSKGMRQKVSIARAVFHKPKLLILDEPTSGLDPQAMDNLTHYLKKLVKSRNMTVMMCTHQLQGLEKIADSIGILKEGNLIQYGESREIIEAFWPNVVYQVVATPIDKANILLNKDKNVKSVCNADVFEVSLNAGATIANVVTDLVENNVSVSMVEKVDHTIKEVYFETIGR
ncbi:ABC transporter ATP-binding protein [Lactiplantibacillus sp. WILCCON 0030]|uniref:ABC transporter ATP-binding protein n=1 Tax=Lactiplantibacillus brownii TaxID=3069269 RepID=A0ABU1A728_9LACO|nr:ABC transporter ATP-binding protein [Lactiplantibacillus brownii]MDQ7936243.1 ABC transporter ATP-binding protein [Lactiplantibacillus brownii]